MLRALPVPAIICILIFRVWNAPLNKPDKRHNVMIYEFFVGDFVHHPDRPDWGAGQIQSIIGHRITVNFEHMGKTIILADQISLSPVADGTDSAPKRL